MSLIKSTKNDVCRYEQDQYQQRSKVEIVNSVIKLNMEDCVHTRKAFNQNKEILLLTFRSFEKR